MPPQQSLQDYFLEESRAITESCTQCGKCVEVCPVIPYGRAAGVDLKEVVGGVIGLLAGASDMLSPASNEWTSTCNGCGECIPACPEGINPRKMLALAGARQSGVATKTPLLFRRMSHAIKVMVAMQLLPVEFKKLFVPPRPHDVPLVFYSGCNPLRTPNLMFNSMTILDAIGKGYELVGGPSSCCGVIAAKWEGQVKTGERVTNNTIDRFENFKPERVLNWCPTCQIHLGETLETYRRTSYDFDHITEYLVENLYVLKSKFAVPINKRAVVHAHVGRSDVCENVDRLLRAIPGLEIVDTVVESGYTCGGSGCSKAPLLAAKEHAALIDRTRETNADILVTLYHGCHRAFMGAEKEGKFQVLNYTDLIVEALGEQPYIDRLKGYQLADDWDLIVSESQPFLKANGLEYDDDWLKKNGPAIFAQLEFKGQLECFGEAAAEHSHTHIAM